MMQQGCRYLNSFHIVIGEKFGTMSSLGASDFVDCMRQMLARIPDVRSRVIDKTRRIGLAVSGGPDSLALAILARMNLPKNRLVAFFVDHGMQSRGVTEDSQKVDDLLATIDIPLHRLQIEWKDNGRELESLSLGKVQETLREKRYQILRSACVENNIGILLTGHNLDDDCVTMLQRMCNGSGIDGLAGMKSVSIFPPSIQNSDKLQLKKIHDLEIVPDELSGYQHALPPLIGHPFLSIPKDRLIATCLDNFPKKTFNIPSNLKSNFDNSKVNTKSPEDDLNELPGSNIIGTPTESHEILEQPDDAFRNSNDKSSKVASTWVIDESNSNLDYRRNELMSLLRKVHSASIIPKLGSMAEGDVVNLLNFFKKVRSDLNLEVERAFEQSVVYDSHTGDVTLVLNDKGEGPSWINNRPVAMRLMMLLSQAVGSRQYPPKTKRILEMYRELQSSFNDHRVQEIRNRKFLAKRIMRMGGRQSIFNDPNPIIPGAIPILDTPYELTKRLQCNQMVVTGATFRPLSREDAINRIHMAVKNSSLFSPIRDIKYGPAFLVQREPPVGVSHQRPMLHPIDISLEPNQVFLWDMGRIALWYNTEHASDKTILKEKDSDVKFRFSFMTKGDTREYYQLARQTRGYRRRNALNDYLARTPGSHIYQAPVVRRLIPVKIHEAIDTPKNQIMEKNLDNSNEEWTIDPTYIGFPTLGVECGASYGWKCAPRAGDVFFNRFICRA